jgi:hypothetical protein
MRSRLSTTNQCSAAIALLVGAIAAACGSGGVASVGDGGATPDASARPTPRDAGTRGDGSPGFDAESAPDGTSPKDASSWTGDATSDGPRRDAATDAAVRDATDAKGVDAATCESDCTVLAYCVDVPGGYTLLWNGTSWAQTESGPSPIREVPQMAALNGTVVLFGGSSVPSSSMPTTGYADTWVWTAGTWVNANVTGPSARNGAAFAPLGNELFLVGGSASSTTSVDTWAWNGSAWTSVSVTGPSDRSTPAMAPLGDNLVLFGGAADGVAQADTWSFDGTTWTPLAVTGPSARMDAHMVPLGNKLVLFGGWGGAGYPSAYTDTWTWDGANWTEVATEGPPASIEESLVAFNGGALLLSPDGGGWMWWFDGSTWTALASTLPICGNGATGFVTAATSF